MSDVLASAYIDTSFKKIESMSKIESEKAIPKLAKRFSKSYDKIKGKAKREKDVHKFLKYITSNLTFNIHFPDVVMPELIKSPKLLNSFHISPTESRTNIQKKLFLIPMKAHPDDRLIYGCINIAFDADRGCAKVFGNNFFTLKKSHHIFKKITVTSGDSAQLYKNLKKSGSTDLQIRKKILGTINHLNHVILDLPLELFENVIRNYKLNTTGRWSKRQQFNFLEYQIFGNINLLKDIKKLSVPTNKKKSALLLAKKMKLDKRNVKFVSTKFNETHIASSNK